jgi:serine-type D-Ala-D-Ala carboxypeptidase/endopeptidase (penicillin-binding protein 4)
VSAARWFLFSVLFMLIPAAQFGYASPLPREIARALNDAGIPSANAAFLIVDLDTGATLLSHNADKPMNPASVMKLVTTAAALDLLSPQFTWRTELLATTAPESATLKTPLYIRASGDPKITWEDLERTLARLRAQGIHTLAGGVVIDKRIFAPTGVDTAAFDNSPLRPYNVKPDAMLFNFKAVGFKMLTGDGALRITPEPYPDGVQLEQNVKLVSGPCGDWKTKLRATFEDGERSAVARFVGTYSTECGEREWFVSLLNHEAFFEGSVRWLWKKVGGLAVGSIRAGEVPPDANALEAHVSLPLSAAVSDVNKFSNNVMARHLLLTLDAQKNSPPAQAARGATLVKAWLKAEGIAAPELVIENGSGLSRDERVSAQTLVALLRAMHKKPAAQIYRESLPIAGVDGTISTRMRNSQASASAWLKTGGLNDVRSLAGYLRRSDGKQFAYVGIMNHPRAPQAFGVLERAVEWSYGQ